jgi:hypothetical protein
MKKDPKQELIQLIKSELNNIGDGNVSASAYDTAFVARLAHPRGNKPMFPESLQWILDNQLTDGSWGSTAVVYLYDRVICTMAAIYAIHRWHPNSDAISSGINYLNDNVNNLDLNQYATVGFELAFPMLYRTLSSLGLSINVKKELLASFSQKTKKKLSELSIYEQKSTLLHTLELLTGQESKIDFARLMKLQEENGSFGCSPSSTAFMLENIYNDKAANFLKKLVQQGKGSVPPLYPIDIFERNWIINNLIDLNIDKYFAAELKPHIKHLNESWTKKGVGLSKYFTVPDIDDSVVSFRILSKYKFPKDVNFVKNFEDDTSFYCYKGELDSSPTHIANLLVALYEAPEFDHKNELLEKATDTFVRSIHSSYLDKWHVSPFYTYSRLMLNYFPRFHSLEKTIYDRVVNTQKEDGGWGYYDNSTPEETALAVFTLLKCNQKTVSTISALLKKAYDFLSTNNQTHNLWIGKCLYSSTITTLAPLQAKLGIINFLH